MHILSKPILAFLLFTSYCLDEPIYAQDPHPSGAPNAETATNSFGGVSEFDLSWSTIDSGGGDSSNAEFTLRGTIGQTDTIVMVGEDFTLRGGFWAIPDFTNIDFVIFKDGFESFVF